MRRGLLAGVLLGAIAALPAAAAEKPRDLTITIATIAHAKQRYPTVGDWRVTKDGLKITVSRMSDQRYKFLIAVHEMTAAYLALHAGVTQQAVNEFDKNYEKLTVSLATTASPATP